MNNRSICVALLPAAFVCATVAVPGVSTDRFCPPERSAGAQPDIQVDPLSQVTKGFPGSIKFDEKQRLLEFCPDKDSCDGFAAQSTVPVGTLKDFAYLYIYFFSGYYDLPQWRARPEAKDVAEAVLLKPEYSKCRRDTSIEAARCVLLELSHGGRIKLLFVRYDEGRRNVVHEDVAKELSGGNAPSK